jgi:hypothetical protein
MLDCPIFVISNVYASEQIRLIRRDNDCLRVTQVLATIFKALRVSVRLAAAVFLFSLQIRLSDAIPFWRFKVCACMMVGNVAGCSIG